MNKAQIKAELRRSACEDRNPFLDIDAECWIVADDEANECNNSTANLSANNLRTFYLLVAEAL